MGGVNGLLSNGNNIVVNIIILYFKKKKLSFSKKTSYSILMTVLICILYPLSCLYFGGEAVIVENLSFDVFISLTVSIIVQIAFILIYTRKNK